MVNIQKGKYVEVQYNYDGCISGAKIQACMLREYSYVKY